MELGTLIAEGKTKRVFADPNDSSRAILVHHDTISAGDGARRHVIAGKGEIAGRTTANVFSLLNQAGLATHYLESPDNEHTIVRRCTMLPIEVVMRRLATGSYLRRNPDIAEGHRFEPPLVEFFLKDDTRHDPQITEAQIIADNLASSSDVDELVRIGREVFVIIEAAWAAQNVTLVDLKIEFGRGSNRQLLVADVIDNDSWRIWPDGDKQRMLDKQFYRNAEEVDDEVLAEILKRYTLVAEMTDSWR